MLSTWRRALTGGLTAALLVTAATGAAAETDKLTGTDPQHAETAPAGAVVAARGRDLVRVLTTCGVSTRQGRAPP